MQAWALPNELSKCGRPPSHLLQAWALPNEQHGRASHQRYELQARALPNEQHGHAKLPKPCLMQLIESGPPVGTEYAACGL